MTPEDKKKQMERYAEECADVDIPHIFKTREPRMDKPMRPPVKPGDHLPGVVVVLFATERAPHLQTVLCYWGSNEPPYVIWTFNRETGGLSSGSYFSDPEKATTEYFNRTRQESTLEWHDAN